MTNGNVKQTILRFDEDLLAEIRSDKELEEITDFDVFIDSV